MDRFYGLLDERQRRCYAGLESLKHGEGGDAKTARDLGMDPQTVARGRQQLLTGEVGGKRLRKPGGGGSNGSRSRLWKLELQRFTDEFGLRVSVCHFPPGTSKWNKIEHRMFSHVTQNWRGRPLVSHEVVVNLIGATTSKEGLSIHSEFDKGSYPIGIKVTKSRWTHSISSTIIFMANGITHYHLGSHNDLFI